MRPNEIGKYQLVLILFFALFLPLALPSAGPDHRRSLALRKRVSRIAASEKFSQQLRVAPKHEAPVLTSLVNNDEFDILRLWDSRDGQQWILISLISDSLSVKPRRGWIRVQVSDV